MPCSLFAFKAVTINRKNRTRAERATRPREKADKRYGNVFQFMV
jgi:hypothetical protein